MTNDISSLLLGEAQGGTGGRDASLAKPRGLNFINQIHMRQHMFTAAVTTKTQRIQHLILWRIGNGFTIHVERLRRVGTTKLFHLFQIEEPFVGKDIATVHTADRNNHMGGVPSLPEGEPSIFIFCALPSDPCA